MKIRKVTDMRILLVDNKLSVRLQLVKLIEGSSVLPTNPRIYQANNVSEAINYLRSTYIDIIFLNVFLDEDNGFDLITDLRQISYTPLIVFATDSEKYAVRAFNVDALDYIVEPFTQRRIDQTFQKFEWLMNNSGQQLKNGLTTPLLGIELSDRYIILKQQCLISATVKNGVLSLSTVDQVYKTKRSLVWLKDKLINKNFMQVHRNTLVNLEKIREIQPWFNYTTLLVMDNGEKIQVGRAYQKDLNKRLGL